MRILQRGLLQALCVTLFAATPAAVDPNLYLNDVKFLASKEMRGRASGSPELEKAADFIAGNFREFGLKPVEGKSYLQAFPVTTQAKLGKSNRLRFAEGGRYTALRLSEDFVPLYFSAAARINASVVFAGFGITAPESHYDDYAGVDVKGKWVLILRHEPQESRHTSGAQLTSKGSNAR